LGERDEHYASPLAAKKGNKLCQLSRHDRVPFLSSGATIGLLAGCSCQLLPRSSCPLLPDLLQPREEQSPGIFVLKEGAVFIEIALLAELRQSKLLTTGFARQEAHHRFPCYPPIDRRNPCTWNAPLSDSLGCAELLGK